MSPRRILITGATGGLGQVLVREALSRGHSLVATGRSRSVGQGLSALGVEMVYLDLEDPASDLRRLVSGCDSLIHAAALSASWGPAKAFERANLDVTTRLLKAAQAEGVARFVFVSSPSIFADFADRCAIGATHPPALVPLNDYARTKLAAERAVLGLQDPALACCAIRPRALVGPEDRVILPRLVALARRRIMPLPRGGQALMELTDLRDAAWAICEAEQRAEQIRDTAINISGGRPVSVRQIARALSQALGTQPKLVSLPMALARPLATALETIAHVTGSRQEPVLTRYTLATLAFSQTFDLQPAQQGLGYVPKYDALETLITEARKQAVAGVKS